MAMNNEWNNLQVPYLLMMSVVYIVSIYATYKHFMSIY